jgi:ParB family chromosome partitioning protein
VGDHETALEEGWLLVELEQRLGYGLEELARRFDRSPSWVSRRIGLVELLS